MDNKKRQSASALPPHKQIQNDIVNDIIRGVYEKGAMIPNQEHFSRKYGVSRATVRKATDALIENGILAAVKGKGTFVCEYGPNTHQIFGSTLAKEAQVVRNRVRSNTLEIRDTVADEVVAKRLGIHLGSAVVYIERVRLLNGRPLALQTSYLNKACIGDLVLTRETLNTGSLFRLLEEHCGLVPEYEDEEIRAIECPKRVAAFLQMEPQAPVVLIFRTVYTAAGQVMEYCEDYECTDHKSIFMRTFARMGYEK